MNQLTLLRSAAGAIAAAAALYAAGASAAPTSAAAEGAVHPTAAVGRGMQTPGDVQKDLGRATAAYQK